MLMYVNWDVNPELVNLFGIISIRYYSLLFVTGLLLGYWVVKRVYQREKIPIEKLDSLAMFIFAGTIIGARLGHCLFYNPVYYLSNPIEMLLPIQFVNGSIKFTGYQGLASHGGAIGVLLAIIFYSKKNKVAIWSILDKIALAVPLTGAFIRFGNLMNSEIIGNQTNVSSAFIFKHVDDLPRHPTQLYEAISYVIIFILTHILYKQRQNKVDGFVFGFMLFLLFVSRFMIEFLKINQESFENGLILNMGQILSIPFILWGLLIMYKKRVNIE